MTPAAGAALLPVRRTPVSCTIIAMNERDRIGRAIASVHGLVDEVLVVDSGSTDGTQEFATSLGARVIVHRFEGFGPQKRFAEDQAAHDWILNLDADEWLSEKLREELHVLLSCERPLASSYKMRVTIVYPQRETPFPFADFRRCLRLYDKRVTRFAESLVHDTVPDMPDTMMLKGRVYHKSLRSLSHLVRKQLDYFALQKREKRRSRAVLIGRSFVEFPLQFLKLYFLRRHCFGGLYGFWIAITGAFMRWLRLLILAGY